MAQIQLQEQSRVSNKEMLNSFIDRLLDHFVRQNMVVKHEKNLMLTIENSKILEEHHALMSKIDAKIDQYSRSKANAKKWALEFEKKMNLLNHIPRVIRSNIFDVIPSDTLEEILNSSTCEEKDVYAVIEQINAMGDKMKNDDNTPDISDTEQPLFESVDCDESFSKTKAQKRKKSTCEKGRKKQRAENSETHSPV